MEITYIWFVIKLSRLYLIASRRMRASISLILRCNSLRRSWKPSLSRAEIRKHRQAITILIVPLCWKAEALVSKENVYSSVDLCWDTWYMRLDDRTVLHLRRLFDKRSTALYNMRQRRVTAARHAPPLTTKVITTNYLFMVILAQLLNMRSRPFY